MRFFVLTAEPIAEFQAARTEALKAKGTAYGEAPSCTTCGKYIGLRLWLPPFRVELETWGDQFADLIATGTDLLVSERFRQLWERSHLLGLSGFDEVRIAGVKRRRKLIGEQPSYFRAVVRQSQARIDLVKSEFEWRHPPTCEACLLGDEIKRWKRIVIDQCTWTGEEVFIARGLPGEIITSIRFKELCEQNNVTNAVFVPAECYGHDFYAFDQLGLPDER